MGACASEELAVDPAQLELRDLLGISPHVALEWSASERAAARRMLFAETETDTGATYTASLGVNSDRTRAVLATLSALDHELRNAQVEPIRFARADVRGATTIVAPAAWPAADASGPYDIGIDYEQWAWTELAHRAPDFVAALAHRAGHLDGRVRVVAAPQDPFGAVYLPSEGVLLLNPIVLAALEPERHDRALFAPPAQNGSTAVAPREQRNVPDEPAPPTASAAAGDPNPYNFYGSVAECAAAERLRCEACLPSSTCRSESRDAADGNTECQILGANDGRGYYLFCVNLSLAISTVASCTEDTAAQCPQVTSASNQLAALDANAIFLDDASCGGALDGCLADIYGEPSDDFPPPSVDGGPPPPTPPPPRDIDVSCGEQSCEFDPSCDSSCGGSSCDNSADCGSCSDGDSGDGGGGGSCDCGGSDSSNDSGGDCGGDSSGDGGSSCSGGDCSGDGDCGSCGDSGGGCDCGGSGGGSSCSSGGGSSCKVAHRTHAARWSTAVAVLWAICPLLFMGVWLRRERNASPGDDQ